MSTLLPCQEHRPVGAAWCLDCTRKTLSALRSRVEALEGVLQKIADAPCEREQGCIAHRIARAALQPDKGERCGGNRTLACKPSPLIEGTLLRPCPGCPDCREERCETCGGTGWLDPRAEHAPCPGCKEDVR